MKEMVCAAVGVIGAAVAAAFGGWSDGLTTLVALDGKITAPESPTAGQFLVYNGTAWVAQTVPSANGVSF